MIHLRSAAEACDAQARYADFYRSREGERVVKVLVEERKHLPHTGRPWLDMLRYMGQGECIWESHTVAGLIATAAKGLEGELLRFDDPPGTHGIVWMEDPQGYIWLDDEGEDINWLVEQAELHKDDTGMLFEVPLCAIGWAMAETGVVIVGFATIGSSNPVCVDVWRWDYNMPWREVDPELEEYVGLDEYGVQVVPDWVAKCRRLLLALWRFMAQEIVEVETAHVPRSTAKRAQRAGTTSDIRVIRLRRIHHPDSPTEEHAARDWAFRFWQDGHYRTLYRGTDKERRVWVSKGLKGPEGLPIRDKVRKVISVER